jgi:regulator of sigma E protease
MLLTILAFFFVFTIITLAHELGHLYFSKKVGIRVHEFGLGFGPTLFTWSRNNTVYKINLLPILGYVKIAGIDTDDPAEASTPEAERYYTKNPFQKFISIFAGPLMNLVLGFFIFSLVFALFGIPSGLSNQIASVSPGSEAEKVGIKPGDCIVAIDGKKYAQVEDAIKTIHASSDKKLDITIERAGKTLHFNATPKYHKKMKVGLIGFALKAVYSKVSPLKAIYHGGKETLSLSLTILVLFGKLLTGKLALGDLAGPVGIAQITGQYAQGGLFSFLGFLAFFSINVAVINLLPIPAMDGGRLVFILIEAIFRKPINIELENKIHLVGFYLLLGLMALLTVNDFLRILKR